MKIPKSAQAALYYRKFRPILQLLASRGVSSGGATRKYREWIWIRYICRIRFLNDILELYKENKELKLQIKKLCSCVAEGKSRCGKDEQMLCRNIEAEETKKN